VERETSLRRIRWIFNPPSAAWWGGWWERLVRTVKDLLRRILGKAREDVEDLIPLTPSMFLHELPTPGESELDFLTSTGDLQKSLQTRKTLMDEFRMRFRKEYLSQLVQRGKSDKARKFTVGEVVLVGDDNKKRIQWPMARILKLIPVKDGNIRVAQVQTANGILTRPLQRLFPMEVLSAEESEDEAKQKLEGDAHGNVPLRSDRSSSKKSEDEKKTRSGRLVKVPERFGN